MPPPARPKRAALPVFAPGPVPAPVPVLLPAPPPLLRLLIQARRAAATLLALDRSLPTSDATTLLPANTNATALAPGRGAATAEAQDPLVQHDACRIRRGAPRQDTVGGVTRAHVHYKQRPQG